MIQRYKHIKQINKGRLPLLKGGIALITMLMFISLNSLKAQVVNNNNAVISVTSGTVLVGDTIENTLGTIENEGTIYLTGHYKNIGTTHGNGFFDIRGNWVNTGLFIPGNSIVRFSGTGNQYVTSGGDNFSHIIISNTGVLGANRLILTDDVVVNDTLDFTSGNVFTAGNTLYLDDPTSASLKYQSTTGSRVVGLFERGVGFQDRYLFPVGSENFYNPLNLDLNDVPTAGSVISEFVPTDPDTLGLWLPDAGYPNAADSVEIYDTDPAGYWSLIANNGFSISDFDLDMIGNGFREPFQDITRILKRSALPNSPWTLDGTHYDTAADAISIRKNLIGDLSIDGHHFGWGWCRPRIQSQPKDTAVCDGAGAAFSVTASGRQPLEYEWEVHNGSGGWQPVPDNGIYAGLDNDTLFILAADLSMDGYKYRVIITDPYGNFKRSNSQATLVVDSLPVATAVPDIDTLCNGETTDIVLRSDVPGTTFEIDILYTGSITGATTNLTNDSLIQHTLTNTSDFVDSVVYAIIPTGPKATACVGHNDTIVIYVNPTPEIFVEVADTIVCNNTPFDFFIDSVTNSTGEMRYHFDVTYPTGVTGDLVDGDYDIANVTETLVNTTKQVQEVTYYFKAYIDKADGTNDCDNGLDTTITIYVNPSPRIEVSVADTLVCNKTPFDFTIDSLTSTTGEMRYHFDVTYPDGVTGLLSDGNYDIVDVTDSLVNVTKEVQEVTYYFKAFTENSTNTGHCDNGYDTTITIYVNPSPRIEVSVPDTLVCNNTPFTFSIDSLTSTTGEMRYHFDVTYPAGVTGDLLNGDYDIVDVTENLVNVTKEVQEVRYYFKAFTENSTNSGHCDNGYDTTITVYVNPSPRIEVSVPDTLVCNDTPFTFSIDSLTSTTGEMRYHLDVSYPTGVTGDLSDGDYDIVDVTENLVNITKQVQEVTYYFKAFTENSTNSGNCDNGYDTTITIYVNPSPRIEVSVIDTIVCNKSPFDFTIDSLTSTTGEMRYHFEVTYPADVTGLLGNGDYDIANVTENLTNASNEVKEVTYYFKAFIENSTNTGHCDNGYDTTITIYVNPTPEMNVSVPDTIVCDSSTINITVNDDLFGVQGTKVYILTSTNAGGNVIGVQSGGEYAADFDFSDQLINRTNQVQAVTYTFRPRIDDPRNGGIPFCDDGRDTTITIYVNPTPRFTISIADTIICDSTQITLSVSDGLGNVLADKVYDLVAVQSGSIIGIQGDGQYNIPDNIVDNLINPTNQPQWVKYSFRYRLNDSRYGGTPFCDHGIDTSITVWINPTPKAFASVLDDTICNDTRGSVTLTTPTTLTSGVVRFDYTSFVDPGLSGNTNSTDRANGYIIDDLLHNSTTGSGTTIPQDVIYTISPTAADVGCVDGPQITASVTVHPTAHTYFDPANTEDSVTCYLDSDGYALLVAENGVGIFTYQWDDDDFQTTSQATGLPEGFYQVTVTDNQGCTKVESITIKQPDLLVAIIDSVKAVTCSGLRDGYASVDPIGGNHSYSYLWSNDSTGFEITNVSGNVYDVTVTDYKGCSDVTRTIIDEPAPTNVFVDGGNVTCNGDQNGWVEAVGTVSSYAWNNGATDKRLENLIPGTYYVTATNSSGCLSVGGRTVTEPDVLVDTITSLVNVSCEGDDDGIIDIGIKGGNGKNQFIWSNGATTEDITGLSGGTYSVIVTDSLGCEVRDTMDINEPPEFLLSLTTTDVKCFEAEDGHIETNVEGGNGAPFGYLWSNGETSQNVSNLGAGDYYLTVSDSKNCEIYDSTTIIEPPELFTDLSYTDISCYGIYDGRASIEITGGVPDYSIAWSTGETNDTIENLTAGNYSVTIKDMHNCEILEEFEIIEPDRLDYSISATQIKCYGDMDGMISIEPMGGVSPYSYVWSHNNMLDTSIASNLDEGEYTITIYDINNCEIEVSQAITQPNALNIDVDVTDISCFGFADGSASSSIDGGTPDYIYEWSTGETDLSLSYLDKGDYTLSVTDQNDCKLDTTITIVEPDLLSISPVIKQALCPDVPDGSIELNIAGGVGEYLVYWTTDLYGEDVYDIRAGRYEITITDENQCQLDTMLFLPSVREICISIPTAFSPNGDNINETWDIDMGGLYPDVEVEVFDRWGNRVFYSKGYDSSQYWDGTKNGVELPMDSYHYIIYLRNGRERLSGVVTILR